MVGSFPLAFQRSYSTEIITPNPPFAIPAPPGLRLVVRNLLFLSDTVSGERAPCLAVDAPNAEFWRKFVRQRQAGQLSKFGAPGKQFAMMQTKRHVRDSGTCLWVKSLSF
jgi:hypothetical protein